MRLGQSTRHVHKVLQGVCDGKETTHLLDETLREDSYQLPGNCDCYQLQRPSKVRAYKLCKESKASVCM